MSHRDSPLYWSIPFGTWFGTQVRVSIFFPLIVLVLCLRLEDLRLGLIYSGVLFITVLLHEFGHVAAARASGGFGDEILIWPLGGLAFVQPGPSFGARLMTPAAGPLVNLALCAGTLPVVLQSEFVRDAFNPLAAVPVAFAAQPLRDLCLVIFAINWVLLLVNLIPVYPLDGGQMLKTVLQERLPGSTVVDVYVRVGFVCGFVVMLAGMGLDKSLLVAFGAFLLIMNIQESFQLRTAETYDESFLGYDFSQGYTSLERSTPAEEPPPPRRPGPVERWKQRRRDRRQTREREEAERIEQQLDALLEKIQQHGLESLTDAERKLLDRASHRYRDKGKAET
ncbi:MAG TPA: site-2 protease family protein [Planctomycetaceae bacterium]|nr:site-2 protease family protein [Planctomycetaceae bacterium]